MTFNWYKRERCGGVVATTCQGDEDGENYWTRINGISSANYISWPADLGKCLRAMAIYSDNMGDDYRATAVSEVPVGRRQSTAVPEPENGFVNAAPEFSIIVTDEDDPAVITIADG